MRIGPITGSIGKSWPLFVAFDDDPVSCSPGRSPWRRVPEFFKGGGVARDGHSCILAMRHAQDPRSSIERR
jgi:hypothetical protein